jgi:cytochrome d ubiquinol oxidase subunit II
MDLMTWLPVAWFAVIGFGVLMYVVLDGFVLGIGILAPFAEDEEQLDLMMNTAAPIWDGNETWLVLGGAGCWRPSRRPMRCCCRRCTCRCCCWWWRWCSAAWRSSSASRRIDHAGCGRGVRPWLAAGDLRPGRDPRHLVQGIPLVDGVYQGGPFAWFSPFAMLTGAALVAGYALLGSTWLILKTGGACRRWRDR